MNKVKNLKRLVILTDFILIFCSLLFWIIDVYITNQNKVNNIYYFDGTKTWQSPNLYIISIGCLFILPIILFLQIKRNVKNVILCMCAEIIVGILFILTSSGSGGLWDTGDKYYYFASPINSKKVVAEEWSWLQGGGINFYETINEKQIHCIGGISTDDGFKPIENNAYSLKWSDNEININYSFGGGGPNEQWLTKTFKFSINK